MTGFPPEAKEDYLGLWSIGTLFGKTQEVDMAYMRQHGVLRTRLLCADYTLIPDSLDIFIKGGGHRLSFQIESAPGFQRTADADMPDAPSNDDDHNGDDNAENNDDEKGQGDRVGKQSKSNATETDKDNVGCGNGSITPPAATLSS